MTLDARSPLGARIAANWSRAGVGAIVTAWRAQGWNVFMFEVNPNPNPNPNPNLNSNSNPNPNPNSGTSSCSR